jgi:hypothetical protein
VTRYLVGAAFFIASILLLTFISFGPTACTITTTGDDAGSTSGDGSSCTIAGETVGDQCQVIETAFCMRQISGCDVQESLSQCVSDALPACCASTAICNQVATSCDTAINQCASDFSMLDCNSIVTGASPTSCMGIPTPQ